MDVSESGSFDSLDDDFGDEEEGEYEEIVRDEDRADNLQLDYRILWIRDRVLKFLGLTSYDRLFYDLINANNRKFEDKLMMFLTQDLYGILNLDKKIIYFYKTYKTETVQEEVSVWEETTAAQRAKITALSVFTTKGRARLTKSAPGKFDDDDKKGKKGKKVARRSKAKTSKSDSTPIGSSIDFSTSTLQTIRVSETISEAGAEEEGEEATDEQKLEDESGDGKRLPRKKAHSKSAPSDSSSFAPPPGEEDKYVLTKKIVERVKKVPVLHLIFGHIDARQDHQDMNLFYFMRTTEEGVPAFDSYDECWDLITGYLIVGSLNGKFLAAMTSILVHVFKPLVEKQFRGPTIVDDEKVEEVKAESVPSVERVTDTLSAALRRPSDFRRMSITISRRESHKEEENASSHTGLDIRTSSIDRRKSISKQRSTKRIKSAISMVTSQKSLTTTASKIDSKKISEAEVQSDRHTEQCKADILQYLDKLITCTEWTLEHVEGDILLTMPDIPELYSTKITDEMLAQNKEMIEKIEEVVMSWGQHISKVLELYKNKVILGTGPMAEYEFWNEKESSLSMLVEQLKMPIIRRILAILNNVLSPIASAFELFQTDLWKAYSEARENNKFLFTVARFFKLITESDSFKSIADCLQTLTNGLRMIWVLSSYYSNEEKMTSLFERISLQLCQNISHHLNVTQLFKQPLEIVLRKTQDAHLMMKNWKASYMKTREEIEQSGKGARWEFDQKRLFSATEYIAYVCNDLHKVANVLEDFYNIFGDDLKSIINDPAQIDAIVKRVATLINPFEEADFDLFNEFNRENWIALMAAFNEEVKFLENEAKFYIDECFMSLINAESALEVLMKLKNIKTRESIKDQLNNKFDVIMQQFSKEIGMVENIYNRGKRQPPLLRYHPPTAGAIYWVRQLFHRLKQPVLIFQKIPELKHNDVKLMAFAQYVDIAKRMKNFEEAKFNEWVDNAKAKALRTLKKNILKLVRSEPEKGALSFPFDDKWSQSKSLQMSQNSKRSKVQSESQGHFIMLPQGSAQKAEGVISKQSVDTAGSSGLMVSKMNLIRGQTRSDLKTDMKTSVPSAQSQKDVKITSELSLTDKQSTHPARVTWTEFMRKSISLECQLRFHVNFDWHVFDIIHEAELLEQLGFELPTVVRDVGIQRDRLRADIASTEKVIHEYNAIIDSLEKPDIQLLRNTLLTIEKRIQPGVTRLNWSSLNIEEYSASCSKLLKTLKSIVTQVFQMKKELDSRITGELQRFNLVCPSPETTLELLQCKTYFVEVEKQRTESIFAMTKLYQATSPMLIKLESLVEGTSTGSSPYMQLLYEKYARKILVALILCIVGNLEYLNKMLNDNEPLFLVDALLLASEVVLRPSPSEIYSIILHNVKDLVENLKAFPRWMQGTCMECKPIKKEQSEDYLIFSFFEDVMSVQIVNEAILTVQETAQKISVDCGGYLRRWKKFYNLWSFDKNTACEKFAATKPTLLQYDEKFTYYDGILEELKDMADYYDIICVRINLIPLLKGIEEHAKEWKQVLGNFLLADTVQSMKELKEKIERYRVEVELVITGLDRFTLIMQAISDVKKMAIQAEVQYMCYQETYQTVRSHDIEYDPADEEMAYTLQQDWESLYLGALYRASTLESTCDRFSEMTEEQIEEFAKQIAEFAEDFDANGPGSVGDDLDSGLKKMHEYGDLIEELEDKRLNLVNAEILFNLPPADYSDFLRIRKEMEGMDSIYKLYRQQKNARESWAKTLWINLNPQQLIDGMEQFIREFRKLPRVVRNMEVGKALDANMKSFKNSVPLFVELKNEAMRERHWQELMDKTGQHFDMDPDRCEASKSSETD